MILVRILNKRGVDVMRLVVGNNEEIGNNELRIEGIEIGISLIIIS